MLAGCSAASSLPGLGTTTTVPTTQPPSFSELAATGEAYEVRLGAVGATPLRSLVTAHPIGTISTYEVAVLDGESRIDGAVTVEVEASAADGSNERLRLELLDLDVDGLPEAELAAALGAEMTLERDAARVVTDAELVRSADLTRRAELAADAVFDAFVVGAVPLPVPPVGDGAAWQVRWALGEGEVLDATASMTVESPSDVAVVRLPADDGATAPGGVRSTWRFDGGGPFGAGAEMDLGAITILLTRI